MPSITSSFLMVLTLKIQRNASFHKLLSTEWYFKSGMLRTKNLHFASADRTWFTWPRIGSSVFLMEILETKMENIMTVASQNKEIFTHKYFLRAHTVTNALLPFWMVTFLSLWYIKKTNFWNLSNSTIHTKLHSQYWSTHHHLPKPISKHLCYHKKTRSDIIITNINTIPISELQRHC